METDVVWLTSGAAEVELLSTSKRYEVAPLTSDQLKNGVASQVLDPFPGSEREGADEGAALTVKVQVGEDHGPSPQEL